MTSSTQTLLHNRASGILLPLFSLPGPFGIGDIGPAAFHFIDFLAKAGQSYWQILPVGPTAEAFSNSPYMSPSAFAGNPLYISLERLVEKGLLQPHEIAVTLDAEYRVDYAKAAHIKQRLLRLAWLKYGETTRKDELETFATHHPWVKDYSLFQACKKIYNNQAWLTWPAEIKKRNPAALKHIERENQAEVDYFIFEQFLFSASGRNLRHTGRKKHCPHR